MKDIRRRERKNRGGSGRIQLWNVWRVGTRIWCRTVQKQSPRTAVSHHLTVWKCGVQRDWNIPALTKQGQINRCSNLIYPGLPCRSEQNHNAGRFNEHTAFFVMLPLNGTAGNSDKENWAYISAEGMMWVALAAKYVMKGAKIVRAH